MKRGITKAKRKPLAVAVEPVVRRKNALYRACLSCAIGRDAIEGKIEIPANVSPMEWAMFNLLHAVEEIASAIEPNTTAHQRREAAYGDAAGSGSDSTTKGA